MKFLNPFGFPLLKARKSFSPGIKLTGNMEKKGHELIDLIIEIINQVNIAEGGSALNKDELKKLILSKVDDRLSFIQNLGIILNTIENYK